MPYYKNKNNLSFCNNNDILLIHIPKTGGTSIEEYLKNKYEESLFSPSRLRLFNDPKLDCISPQHQTLMNIEKYKDRLSIDFENICIISVVRNPYHRIISDLFFWKLIKQDSNKSQVYNVIIKYLQRNYDNHNLPQYRFICDHKNEIDKRVVIFRTESLTKEIQQFGFSDYVGKTSIKNSYNISTDKYIRYLSEDSIKLINVVYKKDFELFGYDMIQN
jgi:hypothetical protein